MEILKKVFEVQKRFKSTKDARNQFGGYNYRNVETMMSSLRPLLDEQGLIIRFSDTMSEVAGELTMTTTASLIDVETGESFENTSQVVVDLEHKGMCRSQASGASLTYNHKYALMGLLGISDASQDPDAMNNGQNPTNNVKDIIDKCRTLDELAKLYNSFDPEQQERYTKFFTFRKNKLRGQGKE